MPAQKIRPTTMEARSWHFRRWHALSRHRWHAVSEPPLCLLSYGIAPTLRLLLCHRLINSLTPVYHLLTTNISPSLNKSQWIMYNTLLKHSNIHISCKARPCEANNVHQETACYLYFKMWSFHNCFKANIVYIPTSRSAVVLLAYLTSTPSAYKNSHYLPERR